MNIKLEINNPGQMEIQIDEKKGIIIFSEEFINGGPFHQPLADFEFFKKAFYDSEEGLIEWPNTFAISITEIRDVLEIQDIVYIT